MRISDIILSSESCHIYLGIQRVLKAFFKTLYYTVNYVGHALSNVWVY